MKPAFHYEFIAKIIKYKSDESEFEFIETRKEFHNDEPINAREEAIKFYQNYIEVLLESKGLKYESDRRAREALESFYNPKCERKMEMDGEVFYISGAIGNGIGVFMVIDNPIDYNLSEEKENFKKLIEEEDIKNINIDSMLVLYESIHKYELIHGMGDLSEGSFDEESLMVNLERELEYFNHFNYDTGNYLTKILYCDRDEWEEGFREDEPSEITILKTPFDWTGMDKPYWWGEPDEDKEETSGSEAVKKRSWEEIIDGGESNQVEFKPSLLYNYKSGKAAIGVKNIIAKNICAFLNSRGGYLFIGMDDKSGKPQGLKHDFSLSEDKNPKDFFNLEFDQLLSHFLPSFIFNKISGYFIEAFGVQIFVVVVFPSKSRPIFMNGQHGKEFWIRKTSSTVRIEDIEELTGYCLEHWGKMDD